jgi:prolyl-tRNA synthetase
VAPFDALVLPVNMDQPECMALAEQVYGALRAAGVEVLLDDRELRPGAKFKDADLIGIPVRVTLGDRGLREDKLEIRDRRTGTTRYAGRSELVNAVLDAVRGGKA